MPDLNEISGPVRLTISRKLAKGGMGSVYQALQHGEEGFAKTVALKTILEGYSSNSEFVEMFIGEAKLVADLVHQNIVQVYQLGRADGLLYIVMEYVDGVNLKQFIDRHLRDGERIPVELAAYIASRICRGLEYAHKKRGGDGEPLGVVHRDVSPTNIMLTHLGEIKILDFGIAKARNQMGGREGEWLLGKLSYMSPEQAGPGQTDSRSDLFSLGIILWEMLAGRRPRRTGPDANKARDRVSTLRVPPIRSAVSEIPKMLERIVDAAVEHDPAERYQDAGKMGYDLEYYMYHRGYGPTIVTMERYLSQVFPDLDAFQGRSDEEIQDSLPDTLVLTNPDDKK
jgi:serine/threonine-protein kinase